MRTGGRPTDGDRRSRRLRRTRLAFRRPVEGLVGGVHPSARSGRSLDYDDLAPYRPGDDVRDVDWKASARTGEVVLRRHAAEHRQRVVLVVDTGVGMTARAADGRVKADHVADAVETLTTLTTAAADLVGLVAGHDGAPVREPLRAGRRHTERLRAVVGRELARGRPGTELTALLDAATRGRRRRHLVVVVTDEVPLTAAVVGAVRRLRARHDVMWLTVIDADLLDAAWAGHDLLDVAGGGRLVAALRDDPRLLDDYRTAVAEQRAERRRRFTGQGVLHAELGAGASSQQAILAMLARTSARGGRAAIARSAGGTGAR